MYYYHENRATLYICAGGTLHKDGELKKSAVIYVNVSNEAVQFLNCMFLDTCQWGDRNK